MSADRAKYILVRVFFSYSTNQRPPARLSSGFLLDFLRVTITAIVFLAPVIDCKTSPTRGLWRNVGGVLGGELVAAHQSRRGENRQPLDLAGL